MKDIRFIVVLEFDGHRITTDCYDNLKQAIKICDSYYEQYARSYNDVQTFVSIVVYYRGIK